jgi:hypothetical protein
MMKIMDSGDRLVDLFCVTVSKPLPQGFKFFMCKDDTSLPVVVNSPWENPLLQSEKYLICYK